MHHAKIADGYAEASDRQAVQEQFETLMPGDSEQ